MSVVPGWLWLAFALTTVVMMPAMVRRWRSMRGGRAGGGTHSVFDALYTVISRLWLPAAVAVVPVVYVVRLLFF
jgi:hypothetical protein